MLKVLARLFTGLILLSSFTNCDFSTINKSTAERVRFSNLKEVLRESFEIEDRLDVDFNQDGKPDEILIIRYNSSNRRSLVICIKENEEEYSLNVLSSIAVINRLNETSLDPYNGIRSDIGSFTLVHTSTNEPFNTLEHTFTFDPQSKLFYLTKFVEIGPQGNITRTVDDFGEVNIFDFNIQTEY